MDREMSFLMRGVLDAAVKEMADEFQGVFSRETVARCLDESAALIGERPTVGPNFMPIIVVRYARERLWAVAQAEDRVDRSAPEVLFVCERNAGRSQIAAALTHHLSQGRVGVRSAGTDPDEQIDPVVIQAMSEIGVDLALEFPKPLTDEVVRAADVVVTLGCGDACPVYPGHVYQDWPVPDPVGQPLSVVRQIRYALYHHVWELLESLAPDIRGNLPACPPNMPTSWWRRHTGGT